MDRGEKVQNVNAVDRAITMVWKFSFREGYGDRCWIGRREKVQNVNALDRPITSTYVGRSRTNMLYNTRFSKKTRKKKRNENTSNRKREE